jgi:hypothetical protein
MEFCFDCSCLLALSVQTRITLIIMTNDDNGSEFCNVDQTWGLNLEVCPECR